MRLRAHPRSESTGRQRVAAGARSASAPEARRTRRRAFCFAGYRAAARASSRRARWRRASLEVRSGTRDPRQAGVSKSGRIRWILATFSRRLQRLPAKLGPRRPERARSTGVLHMRLVGKRDGCAPRWSPRRSHAPDSIARSASAANASWSLRMRRPLADSSVASSSAAPARSASPRNTCARPAATCAVGRNQPSGPSSSSANSQSASICSTPSGHV